ncbi:MAG: PHP domain-containing protein [Proteobacteria bacterium]|nr:PHP domain-containing protein [Pseudomonadota bacterium]
MTPAWIDLHLHSAASDGTAAPAEVAVLAAAAGLAAAALTDHDTTAGVDEFLTAARDKGLPAVAGVEISANHPHGAMHLVGLFVDHEHPDLVKGLRWLQQGRAERHPRMLARLQELGHPVTWAEVAAQAGGGQVGRPHFARAMTARGWAPSIQAAFEQYLKKGRPAYVDRARLDPPRAIELLKGAGGLAVLAHPHTLNAFNFEVLAEEIAELKDMGLDAVEVWHPGLDSAWTKSLLRLARRLDLGVSGGSDWHGDNQPDVKIGFGRGTLRVPESCYRELLQRRPGSSPVRAAIRDT